MTAPKVDAALVAWVQDETQVRRFMAHVNQWMDGERHFFNVVPESVEKLVAILRQTEARLADREAKLTAAEVECKARLTTMASAMQSQSQQRAEAFERRLAAEGQLAAALLIIESKEQERGEQFVRANAAERQLAAVAKHLEACGECYSCLLECETELHAELGHVANATLGDPPPVAPDRRLGHAGRLLMFARQYITAKGHPDTEETTRRAVEVFMRDSLPFVDLALRVEPEGETKTTEGRDE